MPAHHCPEEGEPYCTEHTFEIHYHIPLKLEAAAREDRARRAGKLLIFKRLVPSSSRPSTSIAAAGCAHAALLSPDGPSSE